MEKQQAWKATVELLAKCRSKEVKRILVARLQFLLEMDELDEQY